jgi:hypothetical protein
MHPVGLGRIRTSVVHETPVSDLASQREHLDAGPMVALSQNCSLIYELPIHPSIVEHRLAKRIPAETPARTGSRQSNRDKRTVEGTRNPLECQSSRSTSVGVRGAANVTAATTTYHGHPAIARVQGAFWKHCHPKTECPQPRNHGGG